MPWVQVSMFSTFHRIFLLFKQFTPPTHIIFNICALSFLCLRLNKYYWVHVLLRWSCYIKFSSA